LRHIRLHADKFSGAIVWSVAKLAGINLRKFGSLINLDFTTEGRLAVVLIITFSWGFQLGGYIYIIPTSTPHRQQVFWRRCWGERRFLQGESLTSSLLLCYSFTLFYFCLHRFIKNTKKIVPNSSCFLYLA
jgi:hypothetical protein